MKRFISLFLSVLLALSALPAGAAFASEETMAISAGQSVTVKLDGKLMPCTPKEIEILWTLANNPGMVFSREHLLQSIWGYDFLGDTRAVDSHIKRIRAKLCKEGNGWDIKTVWGVGYRFEIGE